MLEVLGTVAQHKTWSKGDELPGEKQLKWKQEVLGLSELMSLGWFGLRFTNLEMGFWPKLACSQEALSMKTRHNQQRSIRLLRFSPLRLNKQTKKYLKANKLCVLVLH